jgi:hypothetical protein
VKPCDFHTVSESVVVNSTNLVVAAGVPDTWGDVTAWDGNGGPTQSEVQVSICAFGDVTLSNLEPFARTEDGDCSFGVLATSVELTGTADVAASATDVDDTTDEITLTSHTFHTGQICRVTTSNTLPAGLAINTDYWVIKVDANTIQLAASYADAIAGTAIDLTTAGVGNQTITASDAAAMYRFGHVQDAQYYGFLASAHAGSIPVRIALKVVTRYQ